MKALTIHQPYAHLIVTPQAELPPGAVQKWVENRTWYTKIRGDIAIHAGKSLEWINGEAWPDAPGRRKLKQEDFPDFAFGAIVGVARLEAVVYLAELKRRVAERQGFPGLPLTQCCLMLNHAHTEGPYCFVLTNVRRLKIPIPINGAQKFWNVPPWAVRKMETQLGKNQAWLA